MLLAPPGSGVLPLTQAPTAAQWEGSSEVEVVAQNSEAPTQASRPVSLQGKDRLLFLMGMAKLSAGSNSHLKPHGHLLAVLMTSC